MTKQIYIEVEENDNCEYMPMQLYEAKGDPVLVSRVKLFDPDKPHGMYDVVGWSSVSEGSPVPAEYVPVSDSGQAVVHLISGGDWGVRLKLSSVNEEWNIHSPNQFGEPYLMLTDAADVMLD